MSTAFSATAPRMTQDDLWQEWSSFTEAKQREAACDLYGKRTTSPILEDPQYLKKKLGGLEKHLLSIEQKPEFERALSLHPSLVNSIKFRLMFLRAEQFDEAVSDVA